MLTTHNNISSKQLKAAKEALADAIEGSAALAGIFELMAQISEDGGFPFDTQIMSECDSMMTTMNRLLYEQKSRIEHIQTMKKTRLEVKKVISKAKSRQETRTNVSVAV